MSKLTCQDGKKLELSILTGRLQKEAITFVPRKLGRPRAWRFQAEGEGAGHGATHSAVSWKSTPWAAVPGNLSTSLHPTVKHQAENTSNMKEKESNTICDFRRETQSMQFIWLSIVTSSWVGILPSHSNKSHPWKVLKKIFFFLMLTILKVFVEFCYNSASILCFVFLITRHQGMWESNPHPMHWKVKS